MDASYYKDVKTKRGFNYHYYFSKATESKPTLLLLHGFPSTSYDWHFQVEFFKREGYGLIVPDTLGYGGTDKPTDPEKYRTKLLCQDIVEILDAEGIDKCIAIGHDWGSLITSRLESYYPERFLAYGLVAVGYLPPWPKFEYKEMLETNRKALGSDLFGYWPLFCREDAGEVLKTHIDSFMALLFPGKPELWRDHMANLGDAEKWVTSDQVGPPPEYMSKNELEKRKALLLDGGLAGPSCYYKVIVLGFNAPDDATIPPEKYGNVKPVWVGLANKDYVCLAAAQRFSTEQLCPNATIVEFDTDHWLQLAAPDKLNEELSKWIVSLNV